MKDRDGNLYLKKNYIFIRSIHINNDIKYIFPLQAVLIPAFLMKLF